MPALSRIRGVVTAVSVAAVEELVTGPSGVQPKNWLTPGVSTTATSAAADARLVAITRGLCLPVIMVWPSRVPTRATSPIAIA
jgi:hypothetical protein